MCGQYKHCDLIDATVGCPPPSATKRTTPAFHFAFDPIESPKNFRPVRKKSPKRTFKDRPSLCSASGLSMFDTELNARTRFATLKASHQNIERTLGDRLASGRLTPTDGLATVPSATGHFDFFEFAGIDLAATFKIIGALP